MPQIEFEVRIGRPNIIRIPKRLLKSTPLREYVGTDKKVKVIIVYD